MPIVRNGQKGIFLFPVTSENISPVMQEISTDLNRNSQPNAHPVIMKMNMSPSPITSLSLFTDNRGKDNVIEPRILDTREALLVKLIIIPTSARKNNNPVENSMVSMSNSDMSVIVMMNNQYKNASLSPLDQIITVTTPEKTSVNGYLISIGFPQWRHLPLNNSHPDSGMVSIKDSCFPQWSHLDLPDTKPSPFSDR